MRLNPGTSLYLVTPSNGEMCSMSFTGFHNSLTGENYTQGPFTDLEVYTDKEEAEVAASIYKQADKIRLQLVQLLKSKDKDIGALNILATVQNALNTIT